MYRYKLLEIAVRIVVVLLIMVVVLGQSAMADGGATVDGGSVLAELVKWLSAAFGTTIATVVTWAGIRGLNWLGIQVTDAQKSQLQSIVVNGVNDAAARAQAQLKNNPNLAIDVKSQVVNDAIAYAQKHGAETIKALGLDPDSGEAVEAIRARIATAIADPNTPTDPAITPLASGGVAK